MTVSLSNLEILNIIAYMNHEDSIMTNPTAKFSITFAWAFRKNMKKLNALAENIEQLNKEIIDHYTDDKYSYVREEDSERVVKEEYLEEYNSKLTELYMQQNTIEVDKIKLSQMIPGGIEALDNVGVSLADINMLSWFIDDDE